VVGDNTVDRFVGAIGRDLVGGNAVNVAVQLAERGFDVRYFGAVGTDPEGERIRSTLAGRNVDVEGLATVPGRTALTVIRVDDDGERHLEQEDFGVTETYVPGEPQLEAMAGAGWVQIGMVPRASRLRRALRELRPELAIGQDCGVAEGYSDLTVAFEPATAADVASVARTAQAQGATYAVITMGAEGSEGFGPRGQHVRQPALPVDVVDTTGAGDSFIAGFVGAFVADRDLGAAMAAGAEWAARTCGHVGGFPQDDGPPRTGRTTGPGADRADRADRETAS
jgi:sugar/nucleoside kinase (ribokinase family)